MMVSLNNVVENLNYSSETLSFRHSVATCVDNKKNVIQIQKHNFKIFGLQTGNPGKPSAKPSLKKVKKFGHCSRRLKKFGLWLP